MKDKRQIIAIGGGGFSRVGEGVPSGFLIEKYFIKQSKKPNPKVLLIPTASGDDFKYTVDFYKTFSNLGCRTSHLYLFNPPTKDLESYILENDIIYVGGGNTKSMLALWREWDIDKILKKAWENGTVLGGVSAGALCWFEEGVTDSIPGPLTQLQCLGFLKGSFCPHYDGEKNRRPAYHKLIKAGMKDGYAADDYVAFHFVGTTLKKVIRAKEGQFGWKLSLQNKIKEEKIEPVTL